MFIQKKNATLVLGYYALHLELLVLWRSIRLLRIYSVNCVFLPIWRKIRAFYYLSRENFHLWADRQKMNVVLSQKRVIRSHSNFLRSLHSWTRLPKKIFGNLLGADWEIFGVEEKNWKAKILSRVIVIVATLRQLLATDHLHLQYFLKFLFSLFTLQWRHQFWGKPVMG